MCVYIYIWNRFTDWHQYPFTKPFFSVGHGLCCPDFVTWLGGIILLRRLQKLRKDEELAWVHPAHISPVQNCSACGFSLHHALEVSPKGDTLTVVSLCLPHACPPSAFC